MIRGGSRFGRRDRRIEVITADLPTDEYLRMFAAADACLAPSRWEGLGLHLFEATALGVPVMDCSRARRELGWQPAMRSTDALVELLAGMADGAGAPTPPLAPSRR